MNISEPFIRRPVGTSLLAAGLFLVGLVAYRFLPVAPVPRVEFAMIQVSASLPGADPATVASSLAAPLERRLAQISGVSEITSISTLGGTTVTIQFDLNRKVNPADAPIMVLAMTSDTLPSVDVFEYADSIVGQRLSQVEGVSQAFIGGAEKSAVRVQVNPAALASTGVSLEEVRSLLGQANVDSPKGSFDGDKTSYTLASNDQLLEAKDYQSLVLTQKRDIPVKLSALGRGVEGVENERLAGWSGTNRAVLVIIQKQAGANVIETVDRIRAVLPQLERWIPPSVKIFQISDRTTTIRASVEHVQFSLMLSISLVILVIFLFLRRFWPTFIASVTVPLALT